MATLAGNAVAPGLLDRYLGKTGVKAQQTPEPHDPDAPSNLWTPADRAEGDDFGSHGEFDATSHRNDPQLWASQHHGLVAGLIAAAGTTLGALGAVHRRRASR